MDMYLLQNYNLIYDMCGNFLLLKMYYFERHIFKNTNLPNKYHKFSYNFVTKVNVKKMLLGKNVCN